MWIALVITHGLLAFLLLGAITHQVVSAWAPARAKTGHFVERVRAGEIARDDLHADGGGAGRVADECARGLVPGGEQPDGFRPDVASCAGNQDHRVSHGLKIGLTYPK